MPTKQPNRNNSLTLNFSSSTCSLNDTVSLSGSSKEIKTNKNTKLVAQLIENIKIVTVSAVRGAGRTIIPSNFHIQTAISILNDMIDSLDLNDPVLLFLNKKICIPFEFQAIIKEKQIVPNIVYDWKSLDIPNLPFLFGGTYMFRQTLDGGIYIGSGVSHLTRATRHRDHFQGDKPLFFHRKEMDKQETLTYSVLHKIPNYQRMFMTENPKQYFELSAGQIDILRAFSLFPGRVLEQNLIDEFKPSLNQTKVVYHLYAKEWSRVRLTQPKAKTQDAKPVDVLNLKDEILILAISWGEAKHLVGVKTQSISKYVNNTKSYFSPNLNQFVTFRLPNAAKEEITTRNLTNKLINNLGLELKERTLTSLSPQFIYVFKENKTDFKTFYSAIEIFKEYYPIKYNLNKLINKNKIETNNLYLAQWLLRRINIEEALKTENESLIYLATHPDRPTKHGIRGNTPPLKEENY